MTWINEIDDPTGMFMLIADALSGLLVLQVLVPS